MAAIQVQLDRIEDVLSDLADFVSDIMQFREVQQLSEIKSALRVIREMYDRASDRKAVSDTDCLGSLALNM